MDRRELLKAAAAFVAATALPASAYEAGATPKIPLLPIEPPRCLITPDMIVREAILQLSKLNTELSMGEILAPHIEPRFGDLVRVKECQPATLDMQTAVTWACVSEDLTLSIDDYSDRFVVPAMKALYSDLEGVAKRAELGLPVLIMSPLPIESWRPFAARASGFGYAMRVIRDYSLNDDQMRIRLDVLCGFTRQ